MERPVGRLLDLVDPRSQQITNMSVAEARTRLLADDPSAVLGIEGSFALVARDGERVALARSLDRPLRYFLAKEAAGPMLVVADRIDAIADRLAAEGYEDQFHPTYSRMAPAHHVTRIQLVGCPDPNPVYDRFFDPPHATMPPDLDLIGRCYVEAVLHEVRQWLSAVPEEEPVGVLFSGGIDSGLLLLATERAMRDLGQSPARLKAFTLSVERSGQDLDQAREFLHRVDLEILGEPIEVSASAIDPWRAIEVIEDYKPRDVECAAYGIALLEAIRSRYPDWRHLVDGDGGDENLKDYPIEENPELTIRSVVNNSMLYQEGWGVDAIKHSLTYSGGQSRGCVRTYAPAQHLGFTGCSPLSRPAVIAVAEAIPFAELTDGSHERLYSLKGEVAGRGVRQVLGREMPIFAKRRFQHGAGDAELFGARFAIPAAEYRRRFLARYQSPRG